jgi:hypothetical protein
MVLLEILNYDMFTHTCVPTEAITYGWVEFSTMFTWASKCSFAHRQIGMLTPRPTTILACKFRNILYKLKKLHAENWLQIIVIKS